MTINSELKTVAIKKVLGASTIELVVYQAKRYFIICLIGFLIAIIPAYFFG